MSTSPPPPPALKSPHYRFFFIFLIGIVVIVSYQNSLNSPFLFDDYGNIVGNTRISISSITLQNVKEIFSPYQNSSSRKISNLTFALNYYFGQLNPVGFHFVNTMIHIVNGWLVFFLFQWYLRRISFGSQWNIIILSGIGALWWVTNPIHTNAVTYIVQRMTSLSTLFCLASLLLYLKARTKTEGSPSTSLTLKKSIFFYFAAAISWILAMLSKEIAAILPLLIITHEIYFFDIYTRFKAKQKQYALVFLLIFALFIAEMLFFLGPLFWENILAGYTSRDFTLLERLLTEPRVVFHYIGLFLYPLPTKLRLYYDTYQISHSFWSPTTTALALAGTMLWLSAIIFFFKKNKLLSFGLLWTFLCLLIESTVIALELVFEHRFYMPSIGFVLALTAALIWLTQRTSLRPLFFYGCMTIIICSQILGTITRNRTWANPIDFSIDEAQKNPDSVRALSNLGWILIEAGQPTVAEPYLQKALLADPDNIIALNNLFVIFDNPPYNNFAVAQLYLKKILTLVVNGKNLPTDSQALLNLSYYLFKNERYHDSLLLLEQISNFSKTPELYLYIGQCNLKLALYQDAQIALKQALLLEPENPEFKFYYAWSHQLDNSPDIAIKILSDLSIDRVQDMQLREDISKLLHELNTTTQN
jgi:protein O-mannosyl-transferase